MEGVARSRWYFVKARGWKRRRVNPTVVRTWCDGWAHLARVVLWLEFLGYRCEVRRVGRRGQ